MLTFFNPEKVPFRGLRTSVAQSLLAPGEFNASEGFRWDTGLAVVAKGPTTVTSSAPGTTCLGSWAGYLNGTYYIFSAWVVGSRVGIYYQSTPGGAFNQITSAGGNTSTSHGGENSGANKGRTTFATATAQVTFTRVTARRTVQGGSNSPRVDLLLISNGEDYSLVFNNTVATETQVVQHRPIDLPDDAFTFRQKATFRDYVQVATATGTKTYTAAGVTNQARYKFSNPASPANDPYASGSNFTVLYTVTSSAATDDIAKVDFGASADVQGEQINFFMEGTSSLLQDLFINAKIEISANDSDYYTVYDKTSSNAATSSLPIFTSMDAANTRTMVTLSMANIPATNRVLRYLRFTRKQDTTPTGGTAIFLAIASCDIPGGCPNGTVFPIAYVDSYSRAESGVIEPSGTDYDLLKNIGGPTLYKNGTATTGAVKIPATAPSSILFDYLLLPKNADGGDTITGGLAGQPSNIDVYCRLPGETDALLIDSYQLYIPGDSGGSKQWASNDTQATFPRVPIHIFENWGATGGRTRRIAEVRPPSALTIAMPRARAVGFANNRLFAGNVQDQDGNDLVSDLYISADSDPFRFQPIQESEVSGTRTEFGGEAIQAIFMTAASADGASNIFVLTNESFNALGTAGQFLGSGFTTTALGTRVRINDYGTNEPLSVAERNGVVFYIDKENHVRRFSGGSSKNISRNAVDDLIKAIPASRRGKAVGRFWNDRYELFFTPTGGTTNTKRLAWNEVLQVWEYAEAVNETQSACVAYDSSAVGSGQRLLAFSSANKVYALDEDTAASVAISLKTRKYQSPSEQGFLFGHSRVMMDADQGKTITFAYTYDPVGHTFEGDVDLSSDNPLVVKIESQTREETTAYNVDTGEGGWAGFAELSGTLTSGKRLYRWECDMEAAGEEGER